MIDYEIMEDGRLKFAFVGNDKDHEMLSIGYRVASGDLTVSEAQEITDEWLDLGEGITSAEYELYPEDLFLVLPEHIGALTEAPIISTNASFDPQDSEDPPENERKVWWWPNYAIRSWLDDIIKKREAIWESANDEKEDVTKLDKLLSDYLMATQHPHPDSQEWYTYRWLEGKGYSITERLLRDLEKNGLLIVDFWPKQDYIKVRMSTSLDMFDIERRLDIFRIFDKISSTNTWSKTSFSTRSVYCEWNYKKLKSYYEGQK